MLSTPEVEEGIAFGSWLEVLSAGPESCVVGEGGGVGYASGVAEEDVFMILR